MNDHQLGQIISCQVLYEKPYEDEIQNILNQVAGHFGKHCSYLMVRDRKAKRVYMRQLAIKMILAKGYSQREIASVFGMNRKAISHYLKTIGDLLDVDVDVRADYLKLTA